MKRVFLLSTKFRFFLLEIPPILLLIPTVKYNNVVKSLMHLYPLMVMLCALIIFIPIYFFCGIIVSNEEVKCIGAFSSKDKATIKKERTLVITVLKKRRLLVELYGKNDDGENTYPWLRNEKNTEINLFRAKSNGTSRTLCKILKYFGADAADIERLLTSDGFKADYEKTTFASEISTEAKKVKIFFKETI